MSSSQLYNFLPELIPAKLMSASKQMREMNLPGPGMGQQKFDRCCCCCCHGQQSDFEAVWNVANVMYFPTWLADVIIVSKLLKLQEV